MIDSAHSILRKYLASLVRHDLQRRMERLPGTAVEADLEAIRNAQDSLKRDLAENSPNDMEAAAEQLIRQYGLLEICCAR